MSDFIKYAESKLTQNQYKLTKTRKLVLFHLHEATNGLNALELANLIKKSGAKIDTVTVYRILKLLQELKIIHYLTSIQKFITCQEWLCHNQAHCHHQFVCETCDKVAEIHIDDQEFLQTIQTKFPQIKISKHNFEFAGVCAQCQ